MLVIIIVLIPRQIVFVIGTARYRHTKMVASVPITSYDVITFAIADWELGEKSTRVIYFAF